MKYKIKFKKLIVDYVNFNHPDFPTVCKFFGNGWEDKEFDETIITKSKKNELTTP